jgi:hypothetical protein
MRKFNGGVAVLPDRFESTDIHRKHQDRPISATGNIFSEAAVSQGIGPHSALL